MVCHTIIQMKQQNLDHTLEYVTESDKCEFYPVGGHPWLFVFIFKILINHIHVTHKTKVLNVNQFVYFLTSFYQNSNIILYGLLCI